MITQALEQLRQDNYLNEQRYTEMYVHSRASRGIGPVKIRIELNERGITDCQSELDQEAADMPWNIRAIQVRKKRFGKQFPDSYEERARQSRFLNQRGFSSEQIRQALTQTEAQQK